MDTKPDTLVTVAEIADYLHVSPRTAQRMIDAEELPVAMVGGRWMAETKDLDAWKESRKLQPRLIRRGPEPPPPEPVRQFRRGACSPATPPSSAGRPSPASTPAKPSAASGRLTGPSSPGSSAKPAPTASASASASAKPS